MIDSDGCIYRGEVVHKRVRPVEHKLKYKVFSLAFDVDRLDELSSSLNLFSLNRFNLFSLNEQDHGHRNSSSLSEFAWEQVKHAGVGDEVDRILISFLPANIRLGLQPAHHLLLPR